MRKYIQMKSSKNNLNIYIYSKIQMSKTSLEVLFHLINAENISRRELCL